MTIHFSLKKMKIYLPMVILGCMFLIGMLVLQYTLVQAFQKESGEMMIHRAFSQAELVETRIQSQGDALDLLGRLVGPAGTVETVKINDIIKSDLQLKGFSSVGIVSVQGDQLFGEVLPGPNEQQLMETFRGNRNVQFIEPAGDNGAETALLVSVPLWRDDKVAGAVYGILRRDGLDQLFTSDAAKHSTILCLSNDFKHIILTDKQNQENEAIVSNITDKRYEGQLSQLFQRLYYYGYGVVRIDAGRDYYMAATALTSMNGWYITSVIPADQVDGTMRKIFLGMSLVYVLLATLCLLAVYTVDRNEQWSREQIRRIAFEDDVTGLPNWAKLQDEYLHKPLRPPQALALMDMDEFNVLDSIMGRDYGDVLLARLANELSSVLQPGESICHMRADRFALCLNHHEQLQERLSQLICQVSQSVTQYPVSISVGLCLVTRELSLTAAHDEALMALKAAKTFRGSHIVVYDETLDDALRKDKRLEADFSSALEKGDIRPFFQPKHNLQSPGWAGFEALPRWLHPVYGRISPAWFIPLLEENGLINELDQYMLDYSCRALRRWIDTGKKVLPISVNLSRSQFANINLVNDLKAIVERHGVPFNLIELEVKEQSILTDNEGISEKVSQLHQLGFRLAIDDFGTGYSSLPCLKKLPPSVIKLDKIFIEQWRGAWDSQLIADIVTMARHMGLVVLIEGVETEEQMKMARAAGCEIAQGFYYAHPMSIEACEQLVNGEDTEA